MIIKTLLTDRQTDRQKIILLFFINLLALSPLIIFSHIHYSIDSYGGINQYGDNVAWHIGGYRFFSAFVTLIISFLGHNPILNPVPDIVFFIVLVAVSVTALANYVLKIINNEKGLIICCIVDCSLLITATNVWYTDLLTFPESISLNALGFLLCLFGIILFANSKTVISVLVSSFAFICAAATTQQFIPIFIIYTILVLCIKLAQTDKKNFKEIIFFYLKPCIFIVINSVIYCSLGVLLQKAFNVPLNPRASISIKSVMENLVYFIKNQHSFLKGRGFFSTEILTTCYLIVAVIVVISLVFFWRKTRQLAKTVIVGLSFIAAYVAAYLPGLVSTSHATRALCALFSMFALFAIGAVVLYNNKIISTALAFILFFVYALNIYKTVDMGINQIVGNTKEAAYADNVCYAIEKYEDKNNVTVDYIGIAYDKHGDTNTEALYVDYAIEPLLQMHIGKDIKYIDVPDSVVNKYFAEKDWTSYDSEEQIVYDENNVYICVY